MKTERREYRGFSARRMRTDPPPARGDGRPPGRDGRPITLNGAKVFNERVWAAITRSFNLSNREQQLVRGVFNDSTDFSIASALGISPHTVHTHFERLHQKLGAANRAQLILRVVDEFLALTASPGTSLPPVCSCRERRGCPWQKGLAGV